MKKEEKRDNKPLKPEDKTKKFNTQKISRKIKPNQRNS
jgi:hypothetical protein